MANLKKETLAVLKENGKESKDVLWCGNTEWGYFSFDDFLELANFEYDSGFGGQEVCKDILIVGNNWYLERGEYDGSEWWDFKVKPEQPKEYKKPTALRYWGDSWLTLEEANRPGGKYQENELLLK